MPVGVILDEFPTLGKLDSLVADVNLVRKRRISILIGAQTKGQFEMIYGRRRHAGAVHGFGDAGDLRRVRCGYGGVLQQGERHGNDRRQPGRSKQPSPPAPAA